MAPHEPKTGGKCRSLFLIYKKGPEDSVENCRRIGLSNVLGTVHRVLLSRESMNILLNKIIDTMLQRAFSRGVDGHCEHTIVNAEAVKNNRKNSRSLYFISLDIRDTFGCTSQDLILFLLERSRAPEPVRRYIIANFLDRLRTRVQTNKWVTDDVPIRLGAMQGDKLSSMLFLLVINPIITYQHEKELARTRSSSQRRRYSYYCHAFC